jgi:tetratricopeptide (TPR) repeat protein
MQIRLCQFARVILGMLSGILGGSVSSAQVATNPTPASVAVIISIEPPINHGVRVQRVGAAAFSAASLGQRLQPGDLIETDTRSRAVLRFAEVETISLAPGLVLCIEAGSGRKRGLTLLRGLLHFFHRGPPDEFETRSRAVGAIIRGTEFLFEVAEDGTTTLTLFDGDVSLTNEFGQLTLRSGEAARAAPGQPPARTAFIEANTLLQWRFYYPGVLDLEELRLSAGEAGALGESLAAYRSGDLLAALAKYPPTREPASDDEKIYLAALLLSVGRVDETERLLDSVRPEPDPAVRRTMLAAALRRVIAATTRDSSRITHHASRITNSPSSWLAESYWLQSEANLDAARAAARKATELSPTFAFAWSRLAELEFSFGHTRAARNAVETSLRLAPRNAQAVALRGFLLAADNRIAAALAAFDEAIAIDPALGNAWLGRGLCRIRQGRADEGRDDLQVAATIEPQRALLRSYLGKAFSEVGDERHASHELELAQAFDPRDPTARLYSALLNQQRNRVNDGVRDLERSIALNTNRAVFRSQLLLDQDRAVRGANLAWLYRDAGLLDESVRAAVHAVNEDYASPGGHVFLANSYAQLNELTANNLRYETAQVNEYLLATLLSPVGVGALSQAVSQQEYGRLFEQDRLGVASSTEYLSRGSWRQYAAQFGRVGNLSYSLDASYLWDPGQRRNNDVEVTAFSAQTKVQLTAADSFYVQAARARIRSGDLAQYYEAAEANPLVRQRETQEPTLLAGYHREWRPGVHTLFLGGWVRDILEVSNPLSGGLILETNLATGRIGEVTPFTTNQLDYRSELNLYSAELQQIFQRRQHTLIAGARFQHGEFETQSRSAIPLFIAPTPPARIYFPGFFDNPPQDVAVDLQRLTFYGYHLWQVADTLRLVGGLSYDRLRAPVNHRFPPLSGGDETTARLSPKAGLLWTPRANTLVRAAYLQSLGGVSLDQSVRLEPSQVAGFNQAWRSVVPESAAGSLAGARIEQWGVALDHKAPTGTYLGLTGEWLQSEAERTRGVFAWSGLPSSITQAGARERIQFEEQSVTASLSQLVGEWWSLGARYRFGRAGLQSRFPEVPSAALQRPPFVRQTDAEALLHQAAVVVVCNHPSGFFGQFDARWMAQDNLGDTSSLADDEFWQFNLWAGWRGWQRRVETRVGLLNLTGRDYRLNPLNQTPTLPRERTLVVGLKFYF